MKNDLVDTAATRRYGPVSFVSTLATILTVEFVAWVTAMPYPFLMIYYVLPALLVVDLVVYAILARRPATLGQIGRGILIGSLAVPVSIVLFAVGFIVAQAIGPI